MKMQEKKESPVSEIKSEGGGSPKQYYTAEEAMAFLEPRIRAMFK